jgi:hypothetical protein
MPMPEPEPEPEPAPQPQAEPTPAPMADFSLPVPEEPAAAVQAEPAPPPLETVPFVAPRDGFHLSDITDLHGPAAPGSSSPPNGAAAASADEEPAEADRGWHIREGARERGGGRRFPGLALPGSADAELEDTSAHASETQNRFDFEPAIVELRRQIRERLQRRKLDEAAALLQKLSIELGGRAVAELALDAGDRCRALGKSNAGLSCYMAATRADPVYEVPLLRLADVCIDEQDIDLAASYLERVARLLRMRGDDKGAMRIYRKLATIAPFREDIISVLMRAQTTGRFED